MELLTRLVDQLRASGVAHAEIRARQLLIERKQMTPNGELTKLGQERQAMGPEGRAIDRAVKASDGRHKASEYTYDPKTNEARLK